VAADMEMLVAAGVTSFKFFMAYKGVFAVTDEQLLHGLAKAKELGAVAMVGPRTLAPPRNFNSKISGNSNYISRTYFQWEPL
jgi:hypothetical protein